MLRSLLRQLCSGDTFFSPQETAADGINHCFRYGGFITGQFTETVTAKVLQTIDIKLRTIQQTHPYSFPKFSFHRNERKKKMFIFSPLCS